MTLEVIEFGTAADGRRWDAFVANAPEATFFHLWGWREVIHKAFGHRMYALAAVRDSKLEGILPLGHIHSLLFGNALISTPFCVYGGIVATSDEARIALDEAASRLARQLGVDHLEFRNLKPGDRDRPTKDLYVTFRRELDTEVEKNLLAIPRKQRAVVRKGIESGMVSVIDDDIDRFYHAYSSSVRNLGTPVFSRKFFRTLKDVFGDQCEILCIESQGVVVSAVMNFYFRDEVLPYYGGGTEAARDLKANDFMYWEVMRRAVERGIRVFDYGRSKKETGSYRFKTHWGFEPAPLYYEYDLVKAQAMPDINPLNPKYRMFIAAWQKLPLRVSQWLGPWLSRDLG